MKRYFVIIIFLYNQTRHATLEDSCHACGKMKNFGSLQQIVIFNKSNDIQRPIAAILIFICNNKLWFSYPIDLNVIIRKDTYYSCDITSEDRSINVFNGASSLRLAFLLLNLLSRLTKSSSLVFDCRAYTCTRI